MNSWKDYPQFFANGKFKVRIDNGDNGLVKDIAGIEVAGLEVDYETVLVCVNKIGETTDFPVYPNVGQCTLIARKIKDMSDEEVVKQFPNTDPISLSEAVTKEPSMMFADDFLYLLSIGCYPFDQSHFETGEVLDAKEVL